MKRSEINELMRETVAFAKGYNFQLPPFAFWSPAQWATKGSEADQIRQCMLGWDLTDFGSGDFHKSGLILFTIRNGQMNNPAYPKPYAEKLMIVEEEQITPMHFHWNKDEDIINRNGGNLIVQLYNSTEEDGLADTDVTVSTDGLSRTVKAGDTITLTPGESICLTTRMYHKFWGEKGKGKVLVGEVSMVNDDNTDNRFYDPIGRFPKIEEDVDPLYLLFSEYPERS